MVVLPACSGVAGVDAKGTPGSVHVGEVAPISFFTNAQESSPGFGKRPVKPYLTINVKIVGKAIFSSEDVQDDVDADRDGGALFTPALARRLAGCCATFTQTAVFAFPLIPGASSGEPNEILVTLRRGANAAAVRARLRTLVPAVEGGVVFGPQRPAEIVDYRSMGTTPLLLAAALAVGAFSSLGLTLLASVRRRRRDLALLKTLGFTRRQLAATVAWQSTTAVAVGTVVGVPLGIALGRFLWTLFAQQISVVPEPSVPGLEVVGICAGAFAVASLVAALPGRAAGRTPAAALLRAE